MLAKHNFTLGHFGLALGALRSRLEDLQVHHCNDFFTSQALNVVACLPALRSLRLEDIQCRLEPSAVAQLSSLRNVRPLPDSPDLGNQKGPAAVGEAEPCGRGCWLLASTPAHTGPEKNPSTLEPSAVGPLSCLRSVRSHTCLNKLCSGGGGGLQQCSLRCPAGGAACAHSPPMPESWSRHAAAWAALSPGLSLPSVAQRPVCMQPGSLLWCCPHPPCPPPAHPPPLPLCWAGSALPVTWAA